MAWDLRERARLGSVSGRRHTANFPSGRVMDELDRMFRRLVDNIRNGYPELLTQPFEVSLLFQSLIPYRHNRKELGIDTNEDFELTLCRLLAGERSLVGGDDIMRETIREQLASNNPNTAIYREFAASKVALVADAVRRIESGGVPASPPLARAGIAPPPPPPPPVRMTNVPPPPPGSRSSGPMRADPLPSPPPRPSGKVPQSAGQQPAATPGNQCRFCGGALPNGRRVIFCPNCGQNLAISRCPACGSELELNWKFCVTCGRSAGAT